MSFSPSNLLTLLFVLALSVSQAQPVNQDNAGQQSMLRLGSGSIVESVQVFNNRYKEADGSPYLDPNWKSGYLVLVDGKRYEEYYLRFNPYLKELEVSLEQEAQAFGPDRISKFCLGENEADQRCFTRAKLTTVDGEALPIAFYEPVFEGKCKLLTLHSVKFFPASDKSQPYGTGEVRDEFRSQTDHYYLPPGKQGAIHLKKISQGKLLKAIGEKTGPLKAYIKTEGLNVRKPAEAAQLLAYYESLLDG